MANYVFETMTATDASNFTSADRLFFESATVGTLGVVDTPGSTGPLSTTLESITLTEGTHSLTFSAAQLSAASLANPSGLIFVNGDGLVVGTAGNEALHFAADTGHGHGTAIYGFDGNDTIDLTVGATIVSTSNDTVNGGDGDDVITGSSGYTDASHHFTESDYYMGGAGNDTINGGNGNDHIYGNLFSSTAGAADGNDVIHAGIGNDYVNGNAGNDIITGDAGNDRLYGGAGDDSLNGGAGNDYLQGNKGEDTLNGFDGNDTLHGGAGNDIITGDDTTAANANFGNDQLFGDAGDDVIIGQRGYDSLWGGDGNDLFVFGVGDASNAQLATATTMANHDQTDVIMDFTDGSDSIALAFGTVDHVYHQQTGVTFTSVDAAQVYAEQLLDGATAAGTEVAAIQVGADTYLFYNDTGTVDGTTHSINEVIKVAGVAATAFNSDGSDFV